MRWLKPSLVAVAVLVVLAAVLQLTGTLSRFSPFGVDTVDRSHPAVLKELRDLSQYHAATGDYEVVIDIEKDVRCYRTSWPANEPCSSATAPSTPTSTSAAWSRRC